MNKDNRILVGAILVFLILFFIGTRPNGVSGNAILDSSGTSLSISPETVSVGQTIYITVIPEAEGVNQKTSFYRAEDDLRKYSVDSLCNNYKCTEESSFSFIIPNSWEDGVYYAKVYDYGAKSFIVEDFTIVS